MTGVYANMVFSTGMEVFENLKHSVRGSFSWKHKEKVFQNDVLKGVEWSL